jgi:hypothetical protein
MDKYEYIDEVKFSINMKKSIEVVINRENIYSMSYMILNTFVLVGTNKMAIQEIALKH